MQRALTGLKILDLTTLWPGPLCTMILADLGADVVRLEAPDRPDLLRYMAPTDADGEGAAWRMANRNKRSLMIDLRQEPGKQALRRMVQTYDIVVEQFRPGVLDRLGVGYAALRQEQPRLIWCAITSFGQSGPWRDRPGHDIGYLALSGAASHLGRPESGPAPWTALPGDVAGGTWPAVAGILAAALQRQATGEGQFVDIAMAEGALFLNALAACQALNGGGSLAAGQGVLGGQAAYDHYRTRDGRYLAMGALEPKFWAQFCAAMGHPQWADHPQDTPAQVAALKAAIANVFGSQTGAHWQAVFAEVPCCVELVLTTEEALALPQAVYRGSVIDVGGMAQLANPVRLSASPQRAEFAAVAPGSSADQVLGEAGFSAADIAALRQAGALGSVQDR